MPSKGDQMKDGHNIPGDTHFQKRLLLNLSHNKVGVSMSLGAAKGEIEAGR